MIDQMIRRAVEEIVEKQRPCFITIEIQAREQGHSHCAEAISKGMFPYHTPIASSYVPVDAIDSPVREL
ncbi:hypothetical protein F9C07_8180 [Aspergillus flavus]|uniref:Uncharacterized protein n=1 Tax=Aspergillus flavus (strain ATCC 200026 / FGSC A1120 / IAM 13836 / NRRL 3357 / JCM 12722 / SRRC 167) TaxID=332952 RepID=A0A7U2R2I0_ASPFN|nr:hypothetical protein F9C07_8180 [Aspergillus flavus]